jgi:ABC-type transporter Mla maintaining outer membrane lipid asymmetry ATPase subunit MlaF
MSVACPLGMSLCLALTRDVSTVLKVAYEYSYVTKPTVATHHDYQQMNSQTEPLMDTFVASFELIRLID